MGPSELENLFTISMIAGLLHDIKRKEQDHAVRGSIEAEKILTKLGMGLRERQYIADAIRNHEAFQETFDRDDMAGRLVSDALYDADKFRWGPENFSTTLWLMVTAHNTPIEALHRTFREKMNGIEKIKHTFRTETGKRFGPEFIDQGITIGNAIYAEMTEMLQPGRK
jgi:UTP:GlnB (protein PII) uridylyltransferase